MNSYWIPTPRLNARLSLWKWQGIILKKVLSKIVSFSNGERQAYALKALSKFLNTELTIP